MNSVDPGDENEKFAGLRDAVDYQRLIATVIAGEVVAA